MSSTTSSPGSERLGDDAVIDPRATLCSRLGYLFADPTLLELALRHRSWCAEHGGVASNERLEFLGDAVLGLVVTDHLFRSAPTTSEGVLARRRSELVSAAALAQVARSVGLGDALLLGKGEESTGGRNKTSILADAMEGVIGGVYLDGGLGAATRVVLGLLEERISGVVTGEVASDHKSRLQELAAHRFSELPRYELAEEGPEHQKRFSASVRVAGRTLGHGEGRTKKEAEQAAAREAADRLELEPGPVAPPAGGATGEGPDWDVDRAGSTRGGDHA